LRAKCVRIRARQHDVELRLLDRRVARLPQHAERERVAILAVRADAAFHGGLCSGLFHALRTPALLVLDAAPLYVLVLSLGYRALALTSSRAAALGALGGVVVMALTANELSAGTPLHVASRHGVAVLAFAVMVTWIRRRHRAAGDRLLVAVALYAIALAAKIVDLEACALLPVGTHFVWHLAGAAAAYTALRAVLTLERTARTQS
jgi:hypothetical protein